MRLSLQIMMTSILTLLLSCNDIHETQITDGSMESTISLGATVSYKKVNDIRKNDLVVFQIPNNSKILCLRVVGLPGDKIEIKKGQLQVNDKKYDLVPTANQIYTVFSKEKDNFSKLYKFNYKHYSSNYGMVCVNKSQFNEIISDKLIDSIYPLGFGPEDKFPGIVDVSTSKGFNHYYFGPIYIPKVGEMIYAKDKMLTNAFLRFNSDSIKVHDDLLFCIGDSFSDAMDSRIIGLIPKEKILGKVIKIKNVKAIEVGQLH